MIPSDRKTRSLVALLTSVHFSGDSEGTGSERQQKWASSQDLMKERVPATYFKEMNVPFESEMGM